MNPTQVAEQLVDRFADRASDWCNAILVKETRQALKSRQFIATFLLLLVISWVASFLSVFGVDGHASASGRQLFTFYYSVLAVTILIIVPFTAYRSLQSEREQHTYEVLSVTTLKPRQIFLGKLGSAIVQMFIYCSALMPFIAFTYLLRGIDIPTITYLLAVGLVESVAISLVALTASTFASQRQWQIASTFGMLWLLVMLLGLTIQLLTDSLGAKIDFQSSLFWFANAGVLVVVFGYGLLLEQIAVAQLTFDSDNRSTGVRIVASGLHLLVMAVPVAEWLWLGSLKSLSPELVLAAMAQLGIIGIFLVTESDHLSHRLQRNLGRMRLLRIPALMYYPGGSRGLMYVMTHLAFLLGLIYYGGSLLNAKLMTLGLPRPGLGSEVDWDRYLILSQYLLIYVGGAAIVARAGSAVFSDFRPSFARWLTAILALGLTLICVAVEEAGIFPQSKPWIAVLNPIYLMAQIESGEHAGEARMLLAALCGLIWLTNLPGILRAIVETLWPRKLPSV